MRSKTLAPGEIEAEAEVGEVLGLD